MKATESVNNLIDGIRSLLHDHPPIAATSPNIPAHIQPTLRTSSRIFVRLDAIQRPLSHSYDDSNKALKRTVKTYTIGRDGKEDVDIVDLLKPAYMGTN